MASPASDVADAAAAAPPVAHGGPGGERQCHAAGRQQQVRRAPVRGLDGQPQRRLAEHAARHAHGHGSAGKDGEAIGGKPLAGDRHGPDQAEGRRGTDQETAGGDGGQRVAGGEEHAAAGTDQGRDGNQPARPEAVEQQADRDLHAGVAVEIGGRQVAEHRGADGEIAHQLLDHHARSHAHHPGIEKERRRRQPAEQRQQAWGMVCLEWRGAHAAGISRARTRNDARSARPCKAALEPTALWEAE